MNRLRGSRVLVTRAAHQAGGLATLLRAAGAEPIFCPTIAIGPPDDPLALRAAAEHLGTYAWAAFSSRNAVETFAAALEDVGRDVRALDGVRVAAIGPKTADALRAHGVRVALVPHTYVAEAIATALLERSVPGDRILLIRAAAARDVLPATLRARGRFIDDVAGYATRSVADPHAAEKAASADVVTFTSASTVTGFCAAVPDAVALLRGKIVAAIGPITADAAREAGIRVDVVANEFTVDGLVAALSVVTAPV